MKYAKEDYAKYRMERAREALEDAKTVAVLGHWNTVANRLYYACFYAASAYLILNDIQSATHKGIKSAFNLALIESKKLSAAQGKLYNDLFIFRHDADYEDFKDFSQTEIEPFIEQVSDFIKAIEHLILPNL